MSCNSEHVNYVISEPYPIVSDSLEKEFKERCDSPADMLGRIDEL